MKGGMRVGRVYEGVDGTRRKVTHIDYGWSLLWWDPVGQTPPRSGSCSHYYFATRWAKREVADHDAQVVCGKV